MKGVLGIVQIALLLALTACSAEQPLVIGFSGSLSGRFSDLGISGRDGAMLAVNEVNTRGGIDNRKVKLVVKDDRNDPAAAERADRELIEEDAIAIIGHMTSSMSQAVLPLINEEKIVLMSPTSTSDVFTGLDDWFFRVATSDTYQSIRLANYVHESGISRVAIIYDITNRSFTESWALHFRQAFESLGGSVVATEELFLESNPRYQDYAAQLVRNGPQAVVMITGSIDTALLAQQLRKADYRGRFFASGWANTPELIANGGDWINGIVIPQSFNPSSDLSSWTRFRNAFFKEYAREPDFAATAGYEATTVILAALIRSSAANRHDLKKFLSAGGRYGGVTGTIEFDRFGDTVRESYLVTVHDGVFTFLGK